MSEKFGVNSECGKLRSVMVCRPNLAHNRLTPSNCHELLFDDVIWVEKAQNDHDNFVKIMKDRGIHVIDANIALIEVYKIKNIEPGYLIVSLSLKISEFICSAISAPG